MVGDIHERSDRDQSRDQRQFQEHQILVAAGLTPSYIRPELAYIRTMTQTRPFTADQFTPTQWSTEEDKAKFANHFMRFVKSDFKETLFPKWFYKRLSHCFGHIAHFDQRGLYQTWFATPHDKLNFLKAVIHWPCHGQNDFTYCDVERALKAWIIKSGMLDHYAKAAEQDTENHERAELARLKAKYETEAA
jgi:hypothetical protein